MSAGSSPSTYADALTGLSSAIYADLMAAGFFLPEAPVTSTIGDFTFTEDATKNQARIFNSKKFSYVIANSVITHIKNNAVTSTNIHVTVTGTCPGGMSPAPLTAGSGTQTGATGTIS